MYNNNLKVVPDLTDSKIEIKNDTLIIHNLKIKNQQLVDLLIQKQGQEQILEFIDLISLALEIKKSITLDADIKQMTSATEMVVSQLEKAGKNAFENLEKVINDLGDEHKDSSLIKILKSKFMDNLQFDLSKLFDVTNERSPLFQLKNTLDAISKELNTFKTKTEESKRGTQHGRDFNKVMDGIVKEIASKNGDSAEFVNDIRCEKGCKIGDEVVTINSSIVNGNEIKIVWEFKAEKDFTEQKALKELNEAMNCRKAQSGVFVLARDEKNSKWPEILYFEGKRAIIVVDEDDIDQYLVRFAYLWSKLEVTKDLAKNTKKFDTANLIIKLEEARNAIKGFQNVTKSHTEISTSLESAKKWLSDSRERTEKIFKEIEELIQNNE